MELYRIHHLTAEWHERLDEDNETLGQKVVLPPFLDSHRDSMAANLKPID